MDRQLKTILKSYKDLLTSREQTRAGFIAFALEKNRKASPYIQEAKTFRVIAMRAKSADDLLTIPEIRNAMLTASGLSDKAMQYFTEDDKDKAIQELIDKFLKPAGKNFAEEAVYRFLLIRGDSLGGSMRNLIGSFAQQRVVRNFIATFSVMGIPFRYYDGSKWHDGTAKQGVEENVKALSWKHRNGYRVLGLNLKIKSVDKNVDICLFDETEDEFKRKIYNSNNAQAIMFGELKGGIDPAGADEHWKTGNTALERIRSSFAAVGRKDIKTAFIAAAIEDSMGQEIYKQLKNDKLSFAANINVDEQLVSFCEWTIKL